MSVTEFTLWGEPASPRRTTWVEGHERTLTGPPSEPLARRSDPHTSRVAAEHANAGGTEQAILTAFASHDALSDDQLCELLPALYPPTLKTARSRLTRDGYLRATGEEVLSRRGRPMQRYAISDAGLFRLNESSAA